MNSVTQFENGSTLFQPEYGHHIGGEWVAGESGKTIDVINPATGELLSKIQAGGPGDIKRAVDNASAAFQWWSKTHPLERQQILRGIAGKLLARLDDYAMMETLDNGKPISDAKGFDIPGTAGVYDYFANLPLHITGDTTNFPDSLFMTNREPLGVCAAIVPWNIPLFATALKIAPALAAGNTVVLKPAESTCLSVLELFKDCADIIPPGVVNIVTGYGPDVGEALVSHPMVRKVAFTGSKPTARKIMQYASANIIPQTMELGGKSANIICADADLDAAAEGVVMSTIFNKGEVCIAGTRTFVHKSVKDAFMEKLTGILANIRQGDPRDPKTQIGPQASQIQLDKILSYLELGPQEGASVVAGGSRANIAGYEKGFFVQPTIFDHVKNDMRIAQEEIFGPVTCILDWEDDNEVLQMANASSYGLGGGIWTKDLTRAHNFIRQMQTGTVWVNRFYNFVPGIPLGGFKESGFGREHSYESLLHYTQVKSVVINLQEGPLGLYNQ
jgi:aldehyde dehydrogenase